MYWSMALDTESPSGSSMMTKARTEMAITVMNAMTSRRAMYAIIRCLRRRYALTYLMRGSTMAKSTSEMRVPTTVSVPSIRMMGPAV